MPPNFNDPVYGMPPGGLLGNYAAAAPRAGGGLFGGDIGRAGGLSAWFRDNPQSVMALASGLLSGRSPQESMALAAQGYGQAQPVERSRNATVDWLLNQPGADPKMRSLLMANPAIADAVASARLTPHKLEAVAPGSRLADPFTGKFADGGGSGRGDGSPYDLEQAGKAYDFQFGPAANRAMNAPDPQAWYKNVWPTYGNGGGAPVPADQSTANAPAGGLPKRAPSEADTLRWDRASNALVKNYIENPAYKLVANGGPFLARIDAAAKLPGSAVNDQELLDSITKLNTGGGQVTEAQVNLVTKGGSLTDKINIWKNMMAGQGGVLSPDQRAELVVLAHRVFGEYQKLLTPYYKDATDKLRKQGVPEEYWTIPDVATLSKQGGIVEPGTPAPGAGGVTHTWDPQNGLRPVQ